MMSGGEIVNALAKVKRLIPADRAKEIELMASQISIDLSPWMGNANIRAYLETIKTALQNKRLLSFNYSDRNNNITARTIEPYQLALKDSHWYVHGYCLARQGFRLFKISRASGLEALTDTFTPRLFSEPLFKFAEAMAQKQRDIKLRIHKSIMNRVLEYCGFSRFSRDGGEHYFVEFPFIDDEAGYSMLFSFGDKCECLEPENIRAEVKRRIKGMWAVYER
jgi:predicted DNA-binding transcriptional regulator YafY